MNGGFDCRYFCFNILLRRFKAMPLHLSSNSMYLRPDKDTL